MDYMKWDYSITLFIPTITNEAINDFFRISSEKDVEEYMAWLNHYHKDFSFQFKEFIFSRLLEHKHFEVATSLLDTQTYFFNEKLAKQCSFRICLSFNEDVLDYWISKVKILTTHEQSSIYKNFWEEFFSYQFQRNEYINDNLSHLIYVFEKVPFYINSDYDLLNSYLIKSRSDFFKNTLPNLDQNLQFTLLNNISMLCGQYFPDSKVSFKEEFQNFPDLLNLFDKAVFHNKLTTNLVPKSFSKKSKI